MATAEDESAELVPNPRGEGGGLFDDPQKIHEDAKLLGQAIRHKWDGIVDPERVKPLIEKGYGLAENATDPRGYASVMKVIQGFAKLEQEEHRDRSPKVVNNIQNNVHLGTPEQRADSLEARLVAEAQRRGLIASGTTDGDGDGSGVVDHGG